MRRSDAAAIAAGTPGAVLMERAGKGIFQSLPAWQGPVGIVCGKGNNAGDGYVLAVLLREAGISCDLLLQEETFTPDGGYWFCRCREAGIPVRFWRDLEDLSRWPTLVDCIFGTGFRGELTGEPARIIGLINASGSFIVSADINSGLNGDNGLAPLAVHSDLTVSVGHFQPGHFLNQARDWMKRAVNCDIGISPADRPCFLVEGEDLAPLFPPRPHFSNKGTWGTLALIGGSLPYSGAIRLAALADAAMRSGAGIVRVAVPASLCPVVASAILESTLFPLSESDGSLCFRQEEFESLLKPARVAAFGMGVGHTVQTEKALRYLLERFSGILILDADGLNALSALGASLLDSAVGRVILTPHPGEFARLTGKSVQEVLARPIPLAEAFAAEHQVTLLLKGAATVVTDGAQTLLVDRGAPGMATAGSGDVLSGILAALCASHADQLSGNRPALSAGDSEAPAFSPILLLTAAAAWLNGRSGELAQQSVGDISLIASDTVKALPQAFFELRNLCDHGSSGSQKTL